MSADRPLAVAILAAGKGKRMGNPDQAKVLAQLNGKPLLDYVLTTASALDPQHVVVIVGHQRDAVIDFVRSALPTAHCAVQDLQLGTGHAVQQTAPFLASLDADVLILSGDVPLLSEDTLHAMLEDHRRHAAVLTVLTTIVPDPTGYGRIIRSEGGSLERIVEHKDASPAELEIAEINSGVYLVRSADLFAALSQVQNTNAQGEFYLTDIADILVRQGATVRVFTAPDWHEVHGINTPADLTQAARILGVNA